MAGYGAGVAALAQEALESRASRSPDGISSSASLRSSWGAARGARRTPARRGRSGPRARPGARSRSPRPRARCRRPDTPTRPSSLRTSASAALGSARRHVVRDARPEARRRHPAVRARRVQHADDPGRALVAGRCSPSRSSAPVGRRAADVDRQAVRDVGQQRAERHHHLHAERLGEVVITPRRCASASRLGPAEAAPDRAARGARGRRRSRRRQRSRASRRRSA